jgi:hypothetical protein
MSPTLKRLYSSPFEDSETAEEVSGTVGKADAGEPDYSFDGYNVEFLEKIALMPIGAGYQPNPTYRRGSQ